MKVKFVKFYTHLGVFQLFIFTLEYFSFSYSLEYFRSALSVNGFVSFHQLKRIQFHWFDSERLFQIVKALLPSTCYSFSIMSMWSRFVADQCLSFIHMYL
ncbi:hypothetical protein CHS0354_033592 [Potamilus streckersoni]|uniref:Uncharacterized protein n=1 Tax=Potamilus streckersoni TaxID=2493646 RepID=A0AAE0T0T5_9BIVA|nr:hypothetical protein CHS0354_033592 [Potamilus streckersoni]